MDADDPQRRRKAFVEAVVGARNDGERVVFVGDGERVAYEDRTLRLELDAEERERLEELRSAYHVFKIQQPATRKAEAGVVYLSAVTDPKHAADFLEALFRAVYGAAEDYELRVE